ncbi:MAG: cytochrome c [Gammaproteobacteria bacterium]
MIRIKVLAIVTGLSLAASITVPGVARADDQDAIDYRVHIMRTLGEEMGAINMILQQKAPPESFATHVKVLAVTAETAKKAFELEVAGGHAKPEVWKNWPDFAKRLDEFVASTAELAKVAEAGGVAAAGPKVPAALTCKSCHDTYREPKK